MLLGSTLRKLRLASGLSQRDLATRADVSPSFLSLVERDKREPTLSVLRRLAENLRVPFGVLLAAMLSDVTQSAQAAGYRDALGDLVEAVRLRLLTSGVPVHQETLFANEDTRPKDR